MVYSLLRSVSPFENYWGGGGGGRQAPPTSLNLQKCVHPILFRLNTINSVAVPRLMNWV